MIRGNVVIIGIGNELRGDDGVGLMVAKLLRAANPIGTIVLSHSGEGAALMEAWRWVDAVVIIDAVQSGAMPGTICRMEAHQSSLPANFARHSTHAFGLADAIELSRTLGHLPKHCVIYGIEARTFEAGAEISTEVKESAKEVCGLILEELLRLWP